jgi:hypothetical protein
MIQAFTGLALASFGDRGGCPLSLMTGLLGLLALGFRQRLLMLLCELALPQGLCRVFFGNLARFALRRERLLGTEPFLFGPLPLCLGNPQRFQGPLPLHFGFLAGLFSHCTLRLRFPSDLGFARRHILFAALLRAKSACGREKESSEQSGSERA